MAEAVRPRKKHRKKKEVKSARKPTEDRTDELLRQDEDTDKRKSKEESRTAHEAVALKVEEASSSHTVKNDAIQDEDVHKGEPGVRPAEDEQEETSSGKESGSKEAVQNEAGRTEPSLQVVKPLESESAIAVSDTPCEDTPLEEKCLEAPVEQPETGSANIEESEGRSGCEEVSEDKSGIEGEPLASVSSKVGENDAADVDAIASNKEILDKPEVFSVEKDVGETSGTEVPQVSGTTEEAKDAAPDIASTENSIREDTDVTGERTDVTEELVEDQSLIENRDNDFEILGEEEIPPEVQVQEESKTEVLPCQPVEQDESQTEMPVFEGAAGGSQEQTVEATAPLESLSALAPMQVQTVEPTAPLESLGALAPTMVEVGVHNPLQEPEPVEELLEDLKSEAPAVSSVTPAIRSEEHVAAEREDPSEILEDTQSRLLMRQESLKTSKVVAMKEKQLEMYYHNPKLKQQEEFVELFIQICSIERHEFYELVTNYFKARNNMLAVRSDIQSLQNEYVSLKEKLWTMTNNTILAKGMCADNIYVKENHIYQVAQFNPDVHCDLDRLMKYTRSNFHDTFALCSYTAQLSRLQIESYIHQFYLRNSWLRGVSKGAPVAADLACDDSTRHEQVDQLKQCISVLFAFQRRPVNDVEFLKSSRGWLSRMIATLLRLATLDDHLFVLGHVLRCPAGIDQWAACYLQIVLPIRASQEGAVAVRWPYALGNRLVDHFLNMLAFFMRPIKYRQEFLTKMKKSLTPSPSEKAGPFNWTLLDEDGEEDEDTDNTLLNENDLVALLAQYPFDKMFKHILQMTDSDGKASYSVDRVGSHHMMQLLAFASSLITILHQGVQTFNRSRYRQFVKRIGRLIRHTVQQVSDHWLNYRSWRRDVCHDADEVRPAIQPYDLQHSIHNLQVEFDEFFFRATKCIMSAPRLGTWQFMTDMPYTSLSSTMMWRLLWSLHQTNMNQLSIEPSEENKKDAYKWHLSDPVKRDDFVHKLLDMPMSEVIYLLTTFANMSSARPASEKTFINFVVDEIYELSYLRTHTREFCCKIGRELLSAIATTHPFIISTVLSQVQESAKEIGAVSLYLFRGLPLHLWHPSNDDILIVKDWLLGYDLGKAENQLARLVFSKMNWGYNEQEDALFLDLSLHRGTAVLVIEAYLKVLTSKSPGASRLGTGPFSSQEQAFDQWAWDLVPKLRLHKHHQPRPPLLASNGSAGMDDWFGVLPNPDTNTKLYPLQKALQTNVAIGCFVNIAMTKTGHSIESFITSGIPNMYTLIQAGCQRFCLPLLAMVVPMFLDKEHPDYLLANEKFLTIVLRILQADRQSRSSSTGSQTFPGDTTKLFAGMVLTQIQRSLSPGNSALTAEMALEFWVRLLTTHSGWHLDQDICYVLDMLLSAAFCNKGGCSLAEEVILQQYKDQKSETKSQGFISSVLSFVSSGNPLPSLLEKQGMERPWLGFCILAAETKNLEDMGLLREVSVELCRDADATPDVGLKRACQKLKLDYSLPVARLPIYRWAQLALETDIEHPLLPIIWQRFFMIYLQRVTAESGISQRASIGQRYFQSITNLTYLKKLKKRLRQTADFHHEASHKKPAAPKPSPSSSSVGSTDQAEGGEEEARVDGLQEGEFEARAEHHRHLVQLYQMYLLWLEEPLLHDASLYLPSLPSQYEAEKLSRIFNGDQDLWMEYANVDMANYKTTQLVTAWITMSQPDASTSAFSQGLTSEQEQIDSATSRILNRLTHYEDQQEPPPLVPLIAPVPEVPRELLVNNHAMLVFVQDDIKQLLYYADTFSERENRNVVLDVEFLEMVPAMYANKDTQNQLQIQCKSSFNPMHKCKGPAVVTVTYKSRQLNEIVSRRLGENRAEYKQLSIESLAPPPSTVVVSAVHIENAITDLIHYTRALADSPAEFEAAKQTGVSLLYHLGNQFTESARHYPPTRQFFASCIEILGQEFIRPYPDQAQPLLSAILANCNLAGLLAPNLAPNGCGDAFVQMYSDVVRVSISDKQDTAFMLLTKFDPAQWLSNCQPVMAVRSQFIEVVGEALTSCGLQMDNQTMMMFEIYRGHLQAMLMYQFPEHYGDVLRLVLKGSEEHCLHDVIWSDSLKSLGCPLLTITSDSISQDQVKKLIKARPLLSLQQLQETIEWMTTYFSRQRNNNPQCGQFGLHSNWKQYHQALVSFLGYIMHNTIILEAQRVIETNLDVEQAVRRLWTLLSGLFYPWIVALEVPSPTNPNAKQLLPPWVEGDRVPASCMVSMFTHTVGCIQAQFRGYLDPPLVNSLSLLWPFYHDTLARKGLREDVLMTYHQHLVSLPWNQFHPDLPSMELMVRVFEDRGPVCLTFLGNIFPRIPWRQISDSYCQGADAEASNAFLSNLLSLLVIFLNEDNIMKSQGAPMQHLIAQAKEFPWQLLDVTSYNCAVMWQIDRCDPRHVLNQETKKLYTSIGLMRGVARFNMPSSLDSESDSSKRAAYVNLVVKLLCKCSSLDDARKDWFPAPVQRLLNDFELLATAGGSTANRQQELVSLLSTLLTLLNSCSPLYGASDAILEAILSWFEASTGSGLGLPCITAACRTLASVKHSALVVEACIEAHFNTNMDLSPDPSRGWTNVLQVVQIPELTHSEFLAECTKQGAILTLFAYLGQRSPQCQTLEEEHTLYTELIDWCGSCKIRPANEAKVFLWWNKALEMTLHQIEFGSPHWTMARCLNNLIPTLMTLGEDRSSSGLLGAIGFGRHSELSYRFRIVARCMAAFIAAQVLRNGTIRLAPNDPGALTRHRDTQAQTPTSPDAPKPSSLAHTTLKQLDAAIDSRNYVGLTEHARYARDAILNPAKSLKDAPHLLSQLVTVMFPEKHYLSLIRTL